MLDNERAAFNKRFPNRDYDEYINNLIDEAKE